MQFLLSLQVPMEPLGNTDMKDLVAIDELTVYSIVDNESDSLSTACACCLDETSGVKATSEFARIMQAKKAVDFDSICSASHGLSLLLVARIGYRKRYCLFDAGPNPPVFAENIKKLGLDPATIEVLVLSHYHVDHSGGMLAAVPLISKARAAAGLPPLTCDLHPANPEMRALKTPMGMIPMMPNNPTFEELKAMGAQVITSSESHTILDGAFFVSGEIPRHTAYECGLPGHQTKMPGGEWADDPLIMDERYVAVRIRDAGLVVLSSCSHAGIVNVCKAALASAGGDVPLFGVMGGFHLAGGVETRIDETVKDLVALNPKIVLPGHCTGWRAKMALNKVFPNSMQPAVVGGTYTFSTPRAEL